MSEKENVVKIRNYILEATDLLMKAINVSKRDKNNKYNKEEFVKELGIIVGELDVRALCILYKAYPELDDIKNKGIL
jgi:hypothetical protein